MTWLLVSTSPSALMTMPVPAAASLSYRGVVLMIARPSLTLVTMACSPLPLPDGLDEVTAAAIVNPGVGAWLALTRRAMPQPGETVLVLGGHRRVRPDRGGAGRADGRWPGDRGRPQSGPSCRPSPAGRRTRRRWRSGAGQGAGAGWWPGGGRPG